MDMYKDNDLCFLAGLLEGDGYIGIGRSNSIYKARFQIINTDKRIMNWLEEIFGGSVHVHSDMFTEEDQVRRQRRRARCYTWTTTNSKARKLIFVVMPYLKWKERQAELALEFLKITLYRGRYGAPYHIKKRQREIYDECKELNKKGSENKYKHKKEINELESDVLHYKKVCVCTDNDLFFLAGLLEAEGHIGISYSKKSKEYLPHFEIINTDERMINWLEETFSGSVRDVVSKIKNKDDSQVWEMSRLDAKRFMPKILPYLKWKKRQAELVLEFLKITFHRGKYGAPYYIKKRQKEIYNECKELNKTGSENKYKSSEFCSISAGEPVTKKCDYIQKTLTFV